jgi:hypothetical protein
MSTETPTATPTPSGGGGEISLGDFPHIVAFTGAAGSAESLAQWLGIDASVFSESQASSSPSATPTPN